jgi:DNA modification methylase
VETIVARRSPVGYVPAQQTKQPTYVSADGRGVFYERVIVCGSPDLGRVAPVLRTMSHMLETGVFWYGDNLKVMREHVGDETVDLVYLDPPFNSKRIWSSILPEADGSPSGAQRKAFEDFWKWDSGPEPREAYDAVTRPSSLRARQLVPAALSETLQMLRGTLGESNMLAYLSMMSVRLVEMRRVLKPNGSLYLHCDPTASHYLKLILDALFGPTNFRNEIIWKRTGSHSSASGFGPVHDVILMYARSESTVCHPENVAYSEKYLEKFSKVDEKTGKNFQDVTLTGSGLRGGDSGRKWRDHDPTAKGRHWAIAAAVYENYLQMTGEDLHQYPLLDRLERLDAEDLLYWSKRSRGGLPRYKFFETDAEGVHGQDLWSDIPPLNSQAIERTGYPTQKPVALLERILQASSREGDVVLDPFCGCGTAVVAAQRLKRRWVGIDITHVAVSVLRQRLTHGFPGLEFRVRGEPEDVASARRLADEKWEEFQAWMVDRVGGVPLNPTEEKKVAKKGKDHGIDGLLLFRDDPKAPRSKRMVLSVKAGKTTTPEMVDALFGVMHRDGSPLGALLTAYPASKGVYNEARSTGFYGSDFYPGHKYEKIQVVTVEDVFDRGWRGLQFPGVNTSRTTMPPAGTEGASEEMFDGLGRPKRRPKGTVRKPSVRTPSLPGQGELPGVAPGFQAAPKRGSK